MNHIVLGLGFGDEGKGLLTDYLCNTVKPTGVIRFSGGHQAGHTVVYKNKRHVFSNFGSGTFRMAPTFWSKYCTFHPKGFLNEYDQILKHDVIPVFYVDPMAPVTTFYDIAHNKWMEDRCKHGSCGVGINATFQRNESPYKLYVQDLFSEHVLKHKLKEIKNYYNLSNYKNDYFSDTDLIKFLSEVEEIRPLITLKTETEFFKMSFTDYVFEGSQGIMLDQDFGFFPNVTRSHTTSKNALEIIKRNNLSAPEITYVTRSYQTRHGNGFMTDESLKIEDLTNVKNPWQGEFRTGMLNIDLVNHALRCDNNYSSGLKKNIAITCLDQHEIDVNFLLIHLKTKFQNVYLSSTPSSENITLKPKEIYEGFEV